MQKSFGQTVTLDNTSRGLASGNIVDGSRNAMFSFAVTVASGSVTFKQFNLTCTTGNGTFLANATLYRSTNTSYNSSSPGTPVGNVTIDVVAGTVTMSDLSETVNNTTYYYYLVADAVNVSNGGYFSIISQYGSNLAVGADGTNYTVSNYNQAGYTYNNGTPYPISLSPTTDSATGLTSTSTTLTSGLTNLVLYSFSLSTTASATLTALNINSTLTNLSSYFSGFTLYSNSSNSFSGATQVTGMTATISSSYVRFSGTLNTSSTVTYYFLVANTSFTGSPTLPANVQFNVQAGQSTYSALTESTPNSGNYNDFTAFGNAYGLNSGSITVTSAQNGLSSTTLTKSETGAAMFGFGVSSTSTITVSGFNIYSGTSSLSTYFGNGKIYKNSSNTFTGSTQIAGTGVTGTAVTFSGNYATVTGLTESISSTPSYYFLVADIIGGVGTGTQTITFTFTNGQSLGAVIESSPSATSYNNVSVTGNAYTLPAPWVNFAINTTGVSTQTTLVVGQTNVVVYGVTFTPAGGPITITSPEIVFASSTSNPGGYFTPAQIWESTSGSFATASQVSTSSIGNAGGGIRAQLSNTLTLTPGTAYTFYLVATIANGGSVPATFPINVTTLNASSNNPTYTGSTTTITYQITSGYDWVGTSNDFTNKSNFAPFGGSAPVSTLPTSGTTVFIGVNQSYTVAPTIPAGTSLAGLSISNAKGLASPTITLASGTTSTISDGLSILNGMTATFSGPGSLTLPSTSNSSTSNSSTLALTGGATINNAGTFTTGTSSNITLTGSSTLANTGTFTLASTAAIGTVTSSVVSNATGGTFTLVSDATSSARIGQVTGAGAALKGNFSVQRYINGGSGLRGYRLMSSPVNNGYASNDSVYSVNYVAQSSYITGTTTSTNGIDKAGNPTLYLFRENLVPNQSSFTAGNFRGIGNMGTTTNNISYTIDVDGSPYYIPVGNGYLFFFRGDRSVATLALETVTSYVPTNTTLTATGPLNFGSIAYKNWYQPATTGLMYTTTTANTAIRGYNLMGNPYPSPISWTALYNANTTNLSNIMYEYNPATAHYGSYQAGGSGTQNVTDNIGSGSGFFAIATNTGASIVFSESVKSTTQPTTLLMGVPLNTSSPLQYIHIKMVKDSVNFDDAIVGFKTGASTAYVENEDAPYLNGNAPPETFSTLSGDSVSLSINNMPLPGANGYAVKLSVSALNSGTFTFLRSELVGIPTLYNIWLKDNLLKDSIDFRANDTYQFAIDNANAASYGSNRFQLVFSQSPALALHLLNFTATKVTGVIQSQLNWTVENESNYTAFYVQRSTDGKNWSSIGSLQSDGSGSYSFIDKTPVMGTDYYRLQMSDINNNITYSQVITLQFSDLSNSTLAGTLRVYPNPTQSQISIAIDAASSSAGYSMVITNNTGEIVKKVNSAQPNSTYDVSGFAPGMYFIVMTDNSTSAIVAKSKFVKL